MINDNSPIDSHHVNASKHLFVIVNIQISQENMEEFLQMQNTGAETRVYSTAAY